MRFKVVPSKFHKNKWLSPLGRVRFHTSMMPMQPQNVNALRIIEEKRGECSLYRNLDDGSGTLDQLIFLCLGNGIS